MQGTLDAPNQINALPAVDGNAKTNYERTLAHHDAPSACERCSIHGIQLLF